MRVRAFSVYSVANVFKVLASIQQGVFAHPTFLLFTPVCQNNFRHINKGNLTMKPENSRKCIPVNRMLSRR
jgi:hypothetical protein